MDEYCLDIPTEPIHVLALSRAFMCGMLTGMPLDTFSCKIWPHHQLMATKLPISRLCLEGVWPNSGFLCTGKLTGGLDIIYQGQKIMVALTLHDKLFLPLY